MFSEAKPTELTPQFDMGTMPACSYSIRKGSETGPEVHFATVGETVYHVWHCDGSRNTISFEWCSTEKF